jgi:5-methylcytosine-specific restriction endonuclease McrA
MSPVLLLSSSYEPLRIISWQNAVCMFFLGKVEIVEEYDHDIRSVSVAIKAPAVVRLLRYFRAGRKSPPLSRANLLARDNFTCQYCAKELTSKEATLDHVVPRSQGGRTTWENIVCACATCNRKKGGRTPKEAHMKLLSKPIKPDWLPVLHIKLHGNIPSSWNLFLQPASKPGRI